MGLIFIPKLSKKYFYFLAFSISAFVRDFITILFNKYNESKGKNFKEEPIQLRYFDIITNVISDCLQGIFVLFNKSKVKKDLKKPTETKENPLNNSSIAKDKNNSSFMSFFKVMVKICLVDFFCQFIFLLFSLIFKEDYIIKRENNNYLLLVDISSRFIFCSYILDAYFYRHHIVSMIVNFGIFLILWIFDIYYIFFVAQEKETNYQFLHTFIYFIFLIIQTIAYSLEDVLNKIALSRESLTPFALLFYKGTFEIPLLIITTIILLPIHNAFKAFTSLDSNFQKSVLFRRFLFIIFNILRSIFLVQVIDKFSSQHLSILKVLESILMFGYFLVDKKYNERAEFYIPVIAISFIVTIFTSLIYNEILVVNLCGMQNYTQHGLDIQAEKDLRDTISKISGDSIDSCSEISGSCSESLITRNVSFTD